MIFLEMMSKRNRTFAFLYHQKRFVTIEEMSQALNMDRRSIYKYYDVLSNHSLMTDESREPIFHTKHGLGYKFTGTKTDYKTLIRKILQENPFSIYLKLYCWKMK